MKKILLATACAVFLSSSLAAAQSSQGKGGAAMTGETADPSKGLAQSGEKRMTMTGIGTGKMTKKSQKKMRKM